MDRAQSCRKDISEGEESIFVIPAQAGTQNGVA
jgi:hypothetical protein